MIRLDGDASLQLQCHLCYFDCNTGPDGLPKRLPRFWTINTNHEDGARNTRKFSPGYGSIYFSWHLQQYRYNLSKYRLASRPSVRPITVCACLFLWVWVCELDYLSCKSAKLKKSACLANNSRLQQQERKAQEKCTISTKSTNKINEH